MDVNFIIIKNIILKKTKQELQVKLSCLTLLCVLFFALHAFQGTCTSSVFSLLLGDSGDTVLKSEDTWKQFDRLCLATFRNGMYVYILVEHWKY